MLKRLKNFGKLIENASGLWLFLRIGIWIAFISLLLYLIPLPRLLGLLTPQKISTRKWPRDKFIDFISVWLGRDRAFYSRSCLKRSLVLYHYLNLQAESARLVIGVKKDQEQLKAHSWIMLGEAKLFPEENINYRIIYIYPVPKKEPGEIIDQEITRIMD